MAKIFINKYKYFHQNIDFYPLLGQNIFYSMKNNFSKNEKNIFVLMNFFKKDQNRRNIEYL